MAIIDIRSQLREIVRLHLNVTQRYRCLIFQSPDLAMLSLISSELGTILAAAGTTPLIIEANDQFDDNGALACADVIRRIESNLSDQHVLLSGPLHFMAYWSVLLRAGFWSHLATITSGPGIILLDTPHGGELDDSFKVFGRISGTDIRYLKSRLAMTQDRMV